MGEYRRNFSSFLFFSSTFVCTALLLILLLFPLILPLSDSGLASFVSIYSAPFYSIPLLFILSTTLSLIFTALYLALSLSHTMWRCLSTSPPPNTLLLIPLHYTVLGIIKFYMIVTLPLSLSLPLFYLSCVLLTCFELTWLDLSYPRHIWLHSNWPDLTYPKLTCPDLIWPDLTYNDLTWLHSKPVLTWPD